MMKLHNTSAGFSFLTVLIITAVIMAGFLVMLNRASTSLSAIEVFKRQAERDRIIKYYSKILLNPEIWQATRNKNAALNDWLINADVNNTGTLQSLEVWTNNTDILIPSAGLIVDRSLNPATSSTQRWKITAFWHGMPERNVVTKLKIEHLNPTGSNQNITINAKEINQPGKRCVLISKSMDVKPFGWDKNLTCPSYGPYPEISYIAVRAYTNSEPNNAPPDISEISSSGGRCVAFNFTYYTANINLAVNRYPPGPYNTCNLECCWNGSAWQ